MLISLSIKFSRFIYAAACMGRSFLSMSRWHSIACTHLILFIHLSVEWYLGFSPVGLLWRMRLWTLVYEYVWVPAFNVLGLYQWVEFLDHTVSLCLTFWETTKLFFSLLFFKCPFCLHLFGSSCSSVCFCLAFSFLSFSLPSPALSIFN